jgi:hypothetical protein
MLKASLFGLLVAVLLATAGFSQSDPSPATPQKPYRERLLDRARAGDVDAEFELGKGYETGRLGLPKDVGQAQLWYRKAAAQDDPFAEASLGILFQFGKGVPRDLVQAYMWYERAISHATPGDRQPIVELRDRVAQQLTPQQIAEARRLAHESKPTADAEKH